MAGALKRISQLYIDNPVTIGPGDIGVARDVSSGSAGAYQIGQLTQNRYALSPTVSGGTLTVNILHSNGDSPFATLPLYFKIGDYIREVNAQLRFNCAPGTNWFNSGGAELATKEVDYFVYVGYNATQGVSVGFSRIPYGRSLADFSATGTAFNYLHLSGTTGTAATDYYTQIGRFAATLSAGTAYTWSVPTFSATNLVNCPIYESRRLDWAPQHETSGGAYTNLPTVDEAKYQVISSMLRFTETHTLHAAPGGSGFQRFTIPFANPSTIAKTTGNAIRVDTAVEFYCYIYATGTNGNKIAFVKYDGSSEITAEKQYGGTGQFSLLV